MFKPAAKIIADSINTSGDRLTTYVLTYHRMIHSEYLTHRNFSRNASSSRAIPVAKMIEQVETEMVEPLYWGKNQKGMCAREELSNDEIELAQLEWGKARRNAIESAKALIKIGAHKQVVNRLLEPFSSITVICTSTEYQNFFNQRCHPNAQPEIKALADAMNWTYQMSKPLPLEKCLPRIHLPFIKSEDLEQWDIGAISEQDLIKISVGRCARVSYLNHDGKRNLTNDIALHDRLLSETPAHLSPFEHVAISLPSSERRANFTGFESYRYQLENK